MNALESLTFYGEKWGFQGYTLWFFFSLKNSDCEYSLEKPQEEDITDYQLKK